MTPTDKLLAREGRAVSGCFGNPSKGRDSAIMTHRQTPADVVAELDAVVNDWRVSAELIGIRIRNTWPELKALLTAASADKIPADVVAELRVGYSVKKTSGDYHPSGRLASIYPDPDTGSMRYVMKHDCCGAHHIYNASQLTASRSSDAGVTEGWQLVPKELTGAMEDAFADALPRNENASHPNDRDGPDYRALGRRAEPLQAGWDAMLAAALTPPSTEGKPHE